MLGQAIILSALPNKSGSSRRISVRGEVNALFRCLKSADVYLEHEALLNYERGDILN